MLATFDPVRHRKFWLEFELKHMTFAPHDFHRAAQPLYLHGLLNDAADAYFVGLADRVRPMLEAIIGWIESHPEPDLIEYPKVDYHWRFGWDSRYRWHQTVAVAKWLSRGDPAHADFAKATEAQCDAWKHAAVEPVDRDPGEEQHVLSEHMAVALAANRPLLGLKLFAAVDPIGPSELEAPLLHFGRWACDHLARGGKRDAEFVARGAEMLRASLLPNFFWTPNRTEPALWLKAIYWDNGLAHTPEEAIAKAYDSMPGIERPDFVPG
jgi:hypothetical protein